MSTSRFSLSAKYRPHRIKGLVGQDHIHKVLRSFREEPPTSVLLTGPSGSGKTTAGRLICAIVNCLSTAPFDDAWEPCGECRVCVAMAKNPPAFSDYLELNTADSRGIDSIRSTVDLSYRMPLAAKYRVIMLDEIHALPRASMNCALKPIEEPPARSIYILGTSEPTSLPVVMKSRCVQVPLKRLETKKLAGLLKRICGQESISIPDLQLVQMAQAADGLPRIGVALLESVMRGLDPDSANAAAAVDGLLGKSPDATAKALLHGIYNGPDKKHFAMIREVEHAAFVLETMLRYHTETIEWIVAGRPNDTSHPMRAWRAAIGGGLDITTASAALKTLLRAATESKTYAIDGRYLLVSVLVGAP